jgi:hypothetical protein
VLPRLPSNVVVGGQPALVSNNELTEGERVKVFPICDFGLLIWDADLRGSESGLNLSNIMLNTSYMKLRMSHIKLYPLYRRNHLSQIIYDLLIMMLYPPYRRIHLSKMKLNISYMMPHPSHIMLHKWNIKSPRWLTPLNNSNMKLHFLILKFDLGDLRLENRRLCFKNRFHHSRKGR